MDHPLKMKERFYFNKDQAIVQIQVTNMTKSVIYLKDGSWKFVDDMEENLINLEWPVNQSLDKLLVPEQEISFFFKLTGKRGETA